MDAVAAPPRIWERNYASRTFALLEAWRTFDALRPHPNPPPEYREREKKPQKIPCTLGAQLRTENRGGAAGTTSAFLAFSAPLCPGVGACYKIDVLALR
jgi:hypothetical protein